MFPRQIASDLRRFFRGDIRDWHQGRMSSFELLELFGVRFEDDPVGRVRTLFVEFAPEDGALAKALRGGRWSEDQVIQAETFNELARLRASFHASKGGRAAAYEPFAFEDPVERDAKARNSLAQQLLQAEVEGEMFADWD